MTKALEKLILGDTSMKVGNHSVVIDKLSNGVEVLRKYYYHNHLICLVDIGNSIFMTNHCGWRTSSTSRAINDYKKFYKETINFTHVDCDNLNIPEPDMLYRLREGNF